MTWKIYTALKSGHLPFKYLLVSRALDEMLLCLLMLVVGPWGLDADATRLTLVLQNHLVMLIMHFGLDSYWVKDGTVSLLKWFLLQPHGGIEPF